MVFDEARYERDVLEPARLAGDLPPADLLVRYGLAGERLADGVIEHVARVARHWRGLRQRSRYAALAANLLTAHEELERGGPLDGRRLLGLVEQARATARERLRQDAGTLAGAATCVGPATVDRLVGPPGGLLDRVAVGIVLRDAGVRVLEPLPLPEVPDKGREVARHVGTLGLQLSVQAVFGDRLAAGFSVVQGFRLGPPANERLTAEAIGAEIARLELVADGSRKSALVGLLTILRGLVTRPGAIDHLVLWEVASVLRRSPAMALSQRALTEEAIRLGLDRGEAELLALSVREAGPEDRLAERLGQVEHELAEGRLRAAERLAAALPAQGEASALRNQVAAAAARVQQLSADAEQARAAGRTEQEASLLAEALRLATDDDDIRARLRVIPPQPVAGVRAIAGTAGLTVLWQASPSLVGSITYRVVRSLRRPAVGVSDGVVLDDTAATELVDSDVPIGTSLFHTVFASRDGAVWSAGASAGPTVLAPDVADLRVVADGSGVSGSWRAPGATEVLVARSEGEPPLVPSDGRRVDVVSLTGFTDPDVRIGVTYHYRVTAVYGGHGDRHASAGVVASVTPEPEPRPIVDLTAAVLTGPRSLVVQVCWTAPARGAGRLLLSPAPPPWPAGTVLPAAELHAFGRETGGAVERLAAGRRRLVLSATDVGPDGYLTAVTVGRSRVAVGGTVELPMAEPVRDLVAERFGEIVRVGWHWPADSPAARVRWWPPDGAAVELTCSRRRYEAEGLELAVGPGPVTVSVTAVAVRPSGELLAGAVEAAVGPLPPRVCYAITREGWARRRWVLEVVAESECELPGLLLVLRRGTVMPLRPDQGRVLARVPAGRLAPEERLAVPMDRPGSGPGRIRLFPETALPAITLVDPPLRQMVLA